MRLYGDVQGYTDSTVFVCTFNNLEDIKKRINKCGNACEIRLLDNRLISHEQRKKIYASFNDISSFMGEYYVGGKESVKNMLKGSFLSANEDKDYRWFSLSDCPMDQASEFIQYLIEFCFEHNIPTQETLLNRFDNIDRYLWACLKHKKCAICNSAGEVHHVNVIGMGNNRKHIDDSNHEKICLCRKHHQEAHNRGWTVFSERYAVKGILFAA